MHIYLNKETDTIEAVPEKKVDVTFLKSFPGFVKRGRSFCAPAKPAVVYNLLTRIRQYYANKPTGSVTVTKEVAALSSGSVKLRELPESFTYFTSPLRHQEIALRFLYTNRGGGLLLDPGLGKTKIVLDYIFLRKFKKSIIVCPKALLFVWKEEREKHRPELKVHVAESLTWDDAISTRIKKLNDPMLLDKEVTRLTEVAEKLTEDGKHEQAAKRLEKANNPRLEATLRKNLASEIRLLEEKRDKDYAACKAADVVVVNYDKAVAGMMAILDMRPEFMAVDEALVKDPKSGRTKALMEVSNIPRIEVCLMSGTLVNNSPEDVFAPVQMMEPSLIGRSMTKFRERYCVLKGKLGKRFSVGFQNTEELKSILRTCSIIMRKEEWLELPPKKIIPVLVPVSEEIREKYMELASNFITTVDGRMIEADSALTVHCKLSQFGSGFIYLYNDEEEARELMLLPSAGDDNVPKKKRNVKDRETIFFPMQPKADKLEQLMGNEIQGRKFILWYNMSAELKIIEDRLHKLGTRYEVIRGGEKDTGGKVSMFNKDPSIQVLVCQAQSVNYGITVLGTKPEDLDKDIEVLPDVDSRVYTHVFYSLSYSLERFIQQQDRSHRIGIEVAPEYYLLLADLPIEQQVGAALADKTELREDFLEDSLAALKRV